VASSGIGGVVVVNHFCHTRPVSCRAPEPREKGVLSNRNDVIQDSNEKIVSNL